MSSPLSVQQDPIHSTLLTPHVELAVGFKPREASLNQGDAEVLLMLLRAQAKSPTQVTHMEVVDEKKHQNCWRKVNTFDFGAMSD